jgi:cytochrome P450
MLYVFDPDIARQATQDNNIPKHAGLIPFMIHLAGPGDLVSSNGAHWKKWRSIMNPGFAASHLMTLAPGIVDDVVVFSDKLAEHAEKGEVFRLEEDATRLTVDIIGKVCLDKQLGTQRGENEMITAFREQVHLIPNEGSQAPLKMYWPSGIYRRWRNGRIMNAYLGKVLEERFAKDQPISNGAPGQKKQRKRVIIDLALEEYRSQQADAEKGQTKPGSKIDDEFKQAAITQIRTFIFAGHDTTSSTICYAIHMLQKHPESLARIRKEHDEILGSVEDTPQVIKNDPHIVNRLEYTMCVIRETLRLWPAASSTRTGDPGFMLYDPKTGEALPTEDILVWIVHYCQHRNPEIWGESATTFDPSRFLPENAAMLPEGAWRPFEKGPRNCIGQDLALLEARIILALVVRRFEFQTALDSLDELKNDGSFYAKDESFRTGKLQDVDGEELYPILLGTAKPREGMPCRVKMVL